MTFPRLSSSFVSRHLYTPQLSIVFFMRFFFLKGLIQSLFLALKFVTNCSTIFPTIFLKLFVPTGIETENFPLEVTALSPLDPMSEYGIGDTEVDKLNLHLFSFSLWSLSFIFPIRSLDQLLLLSDRGVPVFEVQGFLMFLSSLLYGDDDREVSPCLNNKGKEITNSRRLPTLTPLWYSRILFSSFLIQPLF